MDARVGWLLAAGWALGAIGCRGQGFAEVRVEPALAAMGVAGAYDADGDGQADFFTFPDAAGRITAIAYDHSRDGRPDDRIALDELPFDRCRHLAIILDGFGYEVLKEYYDSGGLRLFHPPCRVISPYPAMTDPAICDLLGCMPAPAMEAAYYDRRRNRLVGGSAAYLGGGNEPYDRLLQYRAGMILDAVAYVSPRATYGHELKALKKTFDRRKTQELLAYLVSSAGMGTRLGKEGQLQALRQLDRLILQVLYETRGLVKVTLMADHGHSYTPAERIGLEKYLADRGWRIAESLRGPRDVAYVRFGLETYASLSTRSAQALAEDLIRCPGVELASYVQDGRVFVLGGRDGNDPNAFGRAAIDGKAGRYRYVPSAGDPLELRAVLAGLRADGEGYYDANDLLAATADGEYPAPLERLWRAHLGLVQNVPDVIVSLEDRYYSGSTSFGSAVRVASTHGGLNRRNSTAFVMSSAGPLPPLMRSAEVRGNLSKLTGTPFPSGK